jgi:predicted GNAT family acetyltransferase
MEVRHHADVDAFLATAGEFLGAREAEHNLFFGVLASLRDAPEAYTGPAYLAAVTDEAGDVVAAAIQTPPHRLILSETDDRAAIEGLAADTADRDLPGVMGPIETVATFVGARAAAGGPNGRHVETDRIFALTTVRRPRPAPGTRRVAIRADRDLVAGWLDAFMFEALGKADPVEAVAMADRWLAGRGRTLWLWEDGDQVVSLTGAGGPTPNGIRIGPVYTPPEARGRGYASNLVAAVSQDALDAGRRFCFLFTDAANPTSNHIYQEIGYEHVRDVHVYEFHRP